MTPNSKNIALFTGVAAVVVAVVAALNYIHSRKHAKMQAELMNLEKNMKELQLERLKKENGKS